MYISWEVPEPLGEKVIRINYVGKPESPLLLREVKLTLVLLALINALLASETFRVRAINSLPQNVVHETLLEPCTSSYSLFSCFDSSS